MGSSPFASRGMSRRARRKPGGHDAGSAITQRRRRQSANRRRGQSTRQICRVAIHALEHRCARRRLHGRLPRTFRYGAGVSRSEKPYAPSSPRAAASKRAICSRRASAHLPTTPSPTSGKGNGRTPKAALPCAASASSFGLCATARLPSGKRRSIACAPTRRTVLLTCYNDLIPARLASRRELDDGSNSRVESVRLGRIGSDAARSHADRRPPSRAVTPDGRESDRRRYLDRTKWLCHRRMLEE